MFSFTYYVKICIESSSHNVHINTFLHALVDAHIFKCHYSYKKFVRGDTAYYNLESIFSAFKRKEMKASRRLAENGTYKHIFARIGGCTHF
jgi:hypothetical protein